MVQSNIITATEFNLKLLGKKENMTNHAIITKQILKGRKYSLTALKAMVLRI